MGKVPPKQPFKCKQLFILTLVLCNVRELRNYPSKNAKNILHNLFHTFDTLCVICSAYKTEIQKNL